MSVWSSIGLRNAQKRSQTISDENQTRMIQSQEESETKATDTAIQQQKIQVAQNESNALMKGSQNSMKIAKTIGGQFDPT